MRSQRGQIEPQRLAVYRVRKWAKVFRLMWNGKRNGRLFEFIDLTDLKRESLLFSLSDVEMIYDGNAQCLKSYWQPPQ